LALSDRSEHPGDRDDRPCRPGANQDRDQAPARKGDRARLPCRHLDEDPRSLPRARQNGCADLVFLGDSITAGWGDINRKANNQEVWKRLYAPRNAVYLGIGGDRTQHVLWRIQISEVDGIKPKAVVLAIGTNNAKDNTAAEVADGITAIVRRLRDKLPQTKSLLLGVFPRDEKPGSVRERRAEVNEKIKGLADGAKVVHLDIGKSFINDDGTISPEIMPDFLHLRPKSYQIWADAIEPALAKQVE
jgi:lysophospholipase L1-like esterase